MERKDSIWRTGLGRGSRRTQNVDSQGGKAEASKAEAGKAEAGKGRPPCLHLATGSHLQNRSGLQAGWGPASRRNLNRIICPEQF